MSNILTINEFTLPQVAVTYFSEFSETTVPGRLGNLCGAPFHELVAAAQEERVLADQLDDDNMIDGSNSSNSMLGSQHLWEEKFRPKSFKELLSDDGINRTLLHWLKLWDKVVFNRDVKKRRVAVNQDKGWKPKVGSGKAATVNEMEDELDDNGRPLKMVSLLHGAPGLGKTTLAHVIANHAGYNVVEINASDDRSLAVFKTKFEAATQMRSVSGRDQRPNCLILDEIDGAPLPTINFLVDCIQGELTLNTFSSRRDQYFVLFQERVKVKEKSMRPYKDRLYASATTYTCRLCDL